MLSLHNCWRTSRKCPLMLTSWLLIGWELSTGQSGCKTWCPGSFPCGSFPPMDHNSRQTPRQTSGFHAPWKCYQVSKPLATSHTHDVLSLQKKLACQENLPFSPTCISMDHIDLMAEFHSWQSQPFATVSLYNTFGCMYLCTYEGSSHTASTPLFLAYRPRITSSSTILSTRC